MFWRRLRLVTACVVSVGLAIPVGCFSWIQYQASGSVIEPENIPPETTVVVLGAAVWPGPRPSRYLEARLTVAQQLYATGRVKSIVVSGSDQKPGFEETIVMRDWLIEAGVPAHIILTDPTGLDTFSTCNFLARENINSDVVLVSQDFHLARGITLCRGQGVAALGVADPDSAKYLKSWIWGWAREIPAAVKAVGQLIIN